MKIKSLTVLPSLPEALYPHFAVLFKVTQMENDFIKI